MSATSMTARTALISSQPAVVCCRCGREMRPSIMYGDLRYYTCRPCDTWAVPHPPQRYPIGK